MTMTTEQQIQNKINHAKQYPYDGRPPVDTAHLAALSVLNELTGRSGVGNELDGVDDEIKTEIVDEITEIIRQVYAKAG